MSKNNDDFFSSKKTWSRVKDELLGCYLKPYTAKILYTQKPLLYVDCFAGKGRFDDGSNGSPIIAQDIFSDCIKRTNAKSPLINSYYIDLKYAHELEKNLSNYSNITVINGKYEDTIKKILVDTESSNVFLYIDPYGIKALDCNFFDYFADLECNSVELLINMNSFGFLREALHALGASHNRQQSELDAIIGDDLIESDPTILDYSTKSVQVLSGIAGGEYWIDIIDLYKRGALSGYEAEKLFSKQYCKRLSRKFKYVLSMPIRLKQNQRPKYRMIHASNHEDGCILMFENIIQRQKLLGDIQTQGQLSLFDVDTENEIIDTTRIKGDFLSHIQRYEEFTNINIVIAEFLVERGIICTPADIKEIISQLHFEGAILLKRVPPLTPTGKVSTFMTQTKKRRIEIRVNK